MIETYVSIDIEATGPVPGIYSMLSLGAAAFSRDGEELGTWTANLDELEGAVRHPDTMAWWETQPLAWSLVMRDQVSPSSAMKAFEKWVVDLPGKKIAAAWPATFDFSFVNWYFHRFVGSNPLGFACLDLRSLAMGLTFSRGYYDLRENQIKELSDRVDRNGLNEHVAVDDAVEQGRLLVAMIRKTKGGTSKR